VSLTSWVQKNIISLLVKGYRWSNWTN